MTSIRLVRMRPLGGDPANDGLRGAFVYEATRGNVSRRFVLTNVSPAGTPVPHESKQWIEWAARSALRGIGE